MNQHTPEQVTKLIKEMHIRWAAFLLNGKETKPEIYLDHWHKNFGVWIGHMEGRPSYTCQSFAVAVAQSNELANRYSGKLCNIFETQPVLNYL